MRKMVCGHGAVAFFDGMAYNEGESEVGVYGNKCKRQKEYD